MMQRVLLALVLFGAVLSSANVLRETVSGKCGEGDTISWTQNTDDGTLVISGEGTIASSCSVGWNKTAIKNVTIEDGVSAIGGWAFSYCSNMEVITIPDSVESFGDQAFVQCTGLQSFTFGDKVTSIGAGAFRGCTGLETVDIGSGVTVIGSSAFSGCENLLSVSYSGLNDPGKESENVFLGCSKLVNVTVPEGYKDHKFCGIDVSNYGSSSYESSASKMSSNEESSSDSESWLARNLAWIIVVVVITVVVVVIIIAVAVVKGWCRCCCSHREYDSIA